MKTIQISDELYDQLKPFVVDPFDDTPDTIVGRLIEIVNKARQRWNPLESFDQCPAAGTNVDLDEEEETDSGFVSRPLSKATSL